MKFGVSISKTKLESLENRAHRICAIIDQATIRNPDRNIREMAGQLVDRIFEWVDEIRELVEVGDEDAVDRARSFQARLILAEKAVRSWPQPLGKKSSRKRRRAAKAPRAA
ncbi:MAG: hypothetical protein KTR25_14135 [Myxococcales bacterium]|nr:hypothetical protein [Myxococcales bacterium]